MELGLNTVKILKPATDTILDLKPKFKGITEPILGALPDIDTVADLKPSVTSTKDLKPKIKG